MNITITFFVAARLVISWICNLGIGPGSSDNWFNLNDSGFAHLRSNAKKYSGIFVAITAVAKIWFNAAGFIWNAPLCWIHSFLRTSTWTIAHWCLEFIQILSVIFSHWKCPIQQQGFEPPFPTRWFDPGGHKPHKAYHWSVNHHTMLSEGAKFRYSCHSYSSIPSFELMPAALVVSKLYLSLLAKSSAYLPWLVNLLV